MARKANKAGESARGDKQTGVVVVPRSRSRSLAFTVVLLAVALVLIIIFALVLMQMRNRGDESAESPVSTIPAILNPDRQDAGVGQLMYLYFRLDDGQILLAQSREVTVKVNETPEEAAVQALIDGPQTSGEKLTRLLPEDTKIVRAEGVGDIFYITFDRTLIRSQSLGETLPTESSLRDRLQLIAQSIANTVVGIGNYGKVQILIDYEDGGYGQAPTRYEFGYSDVDDGAELGALSYAEKVVCNAKNTLGELLGAVRNEDWQKIYSEYLISDGSAGSSLPVVQEFREEMGALPYRLLDWELDTEISDTPSGEAQFLLTLTYIYPDGRQAVRNQVPVRLFARAGLWKIKESAFEKLVSVE